MFSTKNFMITIRDFIKQIQFFLDKLVPDGTLNLKN